MMRIRLALSDGGYVADVSIPQFQKMPEVIVWGERFFAFQVMLTEPEDLCAAEYREVFAYWVPPDIEAEQK